MESENDSLEYFQEEEYEKELIKMYPVVYDGTLETLPDEGRIKGYLVEVRGDCLAIVPASYIGNGIFVRWKSPHAAAVMSSLDKKSIFSLTVGDMWWEIPTSFHAGESLENDENWPGWEDAGIWKYKNKLDKVRSD